MCVVSTMYTTQTHTHKQSPMNVWEQWQRQRTHSQRGDMEAMVDTHAGKRVRSLIWQFSLRHFKHVCLICIQSAKWCTDYSMSCPMSRTDAFKHTTLCTVLVNTIFYRSVYCVRINYAIASERTDFASILFTIKLISTIKMNIIILTEKNVGNFYRESNSVC